MTPDPPSATRSPARPSLDPPATSYRADIDGLRALAVTLVVAYHVGIPGIGGGFVGVDVFFVISGYLITSILWRELGGSGRISWGRFYARRFRRLLPALFVTVLATLVIGCFVMVPDPDLRWLGQSAIAVATFVSNIYFFVKSGGYFGAKAETFPLLNTWSLAVEEQFYIVWPVVLAGCWWLRRRLPKAATWSTLAVLGALTLLSFGAAELMVDANQSAAFYLMPFRLWELSIGGVLALSWHRLPRIDSSVAAVMATVGLALIAWSVLTLDATSRFPGVTALPSVVGTLLVIVAGSAATERSASVEPAASANRVSSALSVGPLVWVGTLSYSWYLIHWPLLVFADLVTQHDDLPLKIAIGVGSLGLAWVSYRFVERPFRHERWGIVRGTRASLLSGVALLAVMVVIGGLVMKGSGSLSRVDLTAAEKAVLDDSRTAYSGCPPQPTGSPGHVVDCSFGDTSGPTLFVVGDSHSVALIPIAREVAQRHGWGVEVLWDTSCPFVVDYEPPPGGRGFDSDCVRENELRMEHLEESADRAVGVVMTSRSASFMHDAADAVVPGAGAAWERAIRSTVSQVVDLGIPVFFMLDGPKFDHDVPRCVLYAGGGCDRSTDSALAWRATSADAERDALDGMAGVEVWDPFAVLCPGDRCPVLHDGDVLYRDPDHLSLAGSRLLGTALAGRLDRFFGDGRPG